MDTASQARRWRRAVGAGAPGIAAPGIAAFGIAVFSIAAGCSTAPNEATRAIASAVRIEAEGCHSSPSLGGGSFVDATHVLTVAHVVAGSDDIDVILSNGSEAEGQVVAIDRKKDLALVSVETTGVPIAVGTMRAGATGTFAAWRDDEPVALPFTARTFVDINASDIDAEGPGLRRGYQIDAQVATGDSGSVLVHDGQAVAIVFARSTSSDQRAWATDISEARELIATAGDTEVDTGGCPKG